MNTEQNTAYAALILRLSLGVMLLAHAYLKVMVFSVPGTVQFFSSVGFPGWMAYPVTFAELAGGVALIIGWNARWVALTLAPILIGAAITHWPNGWVHVSAGGGWEYPMFLIAASVVLGLIGNGAWALESRRASFSAKATAAS